LRGQPSSCQREGKVFDVWVTNIMDVLANDPETFANVVVAQILFDLMMTVVTILLCALKEDKQ